MLGTISRAPGLEHLQQEHQGGNTGQYSFTWRRVDVQGDHMKIILWLILFILCWPLAILALLLYPVFWLLLLPFKLVGIAVEGVFELLRAIVLLPARLLGGKPKRT
jgi:hypothetical protein